jgi:hypothetical protein
MYCTSYTNISAVGLLDTPVIDILEVRSANQPAITFVALFQTLLTAFLWALIAGFLNIKEYMYWKIHSTSKFMHLVLSKSVTNLHNCHGSSCHTEFEIFHTSEQSIGKVMGLK